MTSFIVESTNGESIGWFWITSFSSCEILDQEHKETLRRIYQTKKKIKTHITSWNIISNLSKWFSVYTSSATWKESWNCNCFSGTSSGDKEFVLSRLQSVRGSSTSWIWQNEKHIHIIMKFKEPSDIIWLHHQPK